MYIDGTLTLTKNSEEVFNLYFFCILFSNNKTFIKKATQVFSEIAIYFNIFVNRSGFSFKIATPQTQLE